MEPNVLWRAWLSASASGKVDETSSPTTFLIPTGGSDGKENMS